MHRTQPTHRPQQAARPRGGRTALPSPGSRSLLLGIVSVLTGVLWKPVDWVLTVLGAALMCTGAWSMRAPRPTSVIIDAVVLCLVGGYNVMSAVIKMVDGLPPSPARAVLGLFQILWGIRRFRKLGSMFQGSPFDREAQAVSQVVGAIRQVATSDVAGIFEDNVGSRRRVWKARIEGDRVVFSEVRGQGRVIGTRDTIKIMARPPKVPNGPRETEISVGATRIRANVSSEALRKLAEWKSGRSTRKAA